METTRRGFLEMLRGRTDDTDIPKTEAAVDGSKRMNRREFGESAIKIAVAGTAVLALNASACGGEDGPQKLTPEQNGIIAGIQPQQLGDYFPPTGKLGITIPISRAFLQEFPGNAHAHVIAEARLSDNPGNARLRNFGGTLVKLRIGDDGIFTNGQPSEERIGCSFDVRDIAAIERVYVIFTDELNPARQQQLADALNERPGHDDDDIHYYAEEGGIRVLGKSADLIPVASQG